MSASENGSKRVQPGAKQEPQAKAEALAVGLGMRAAGNPASSERYRRACFWPI
jgi:hypothetical protein